MSNYEFSHHETCPKCHSADNLAVYSNGTSTKSYCFSSECGYSQGYDAKLHRLQLPEMNIIESKLRHISAATFRLYGVGTDETNVYFPYFKDGTPIAAKVRNLREKEFHWLGTNPDHLLFGTQTIKSSNRREVILTEGEYDACASYQMTGIPSLSIPNGAQSAKKAVKKNLEYLESFKTIYVCFDNDEAGQEAADEVMEVLKAGASKLVRLDLKDACEYTKIDDSDGFKQCLTLAQAKKVESYYSSDVLVEKWLSFFSASQRQGVKTGITNLDGLGYRIRSGELTTIMASPAVGKSTLVRQIAANCVASGLRVLLCPFEELDIKYYAQVVGMVEQKKLAQGELTLNERMNLIDKYKDSLFLANISPTIQPKDISHVLGYACRSEDIDLIVWDNITKSTSSSPNQTQDIQSTMSQLVSVAQACNTHVLVVSHTSRNKELKDGEAPSMYQGFNSGAIERFSDTVISMGREPASNQCQVAIRKERYNNCVGETELTYNPHLGIFGGIDNELSNESNKTRSDLRLTPRGTDSGVKPVTKTDTKQDETVHLYGNDTSPEQPRLQVSDEKGNDDICGSKGSVSNGVQTGTTTSDTLGKSLPNIMFFKSLPTCNLNEFYKSLAVVRTKQD
jgi:twinkle protein